MVGYTGQPGLNQGTYPAHHSLEMHCEEGIQRTHKETGQADVGAGMVSNGKGRGS